VTHQQLERWGEAIGAVNDLMVAGQYREAQERLVELLPGANDRYLRAGTLDLLGRAYLKLDEPEAALEAAQAAVDASSDLGQAWSAWGLVAEAAEQMGRRDDALDMRREARRQAFACASGVLNSDRALRDLARVIETCPKDRQDLWVAIGYYLRGPGDQDARLPALEAAAESYPDSDVLARYLSSAYRYRDRHGEAVSAAQRAVDIDPTQVLNHIALARAQREAGRADPAIDSFETAISVWGHGTLLAAELHRELVPLYVDVGRVADAYSAFVAALMVDWVDSLIWPYQFVTLAIAAGAEADAIEVLTGELGRELLAEIRGDDGSGTVEMHLALAALHGSTGAVEEMRAQVSKFIEKLRPGAPGSEVVPEGMTELLEGPPEALAVFLEFLAGTRPHRSTVDSLGFTRPGPLEVCSEVTALAPDCAFVRILAAEALISSDPAAAVDVAWEAVEHTSEDTALGGAARSLHQAAQAALERQEDEPQ
jgi:tetratricopeptide (TPR) repeat protein